MCIRLITQRIFKEKPNPNQETFTREEVLDMFAVFVSRFNTRPFTNNARISRKLLVKEGWIDDLSLYAFELKRNGEL